MIRTRMKLLGAALTVAALLVIPGVRAFAAGSVTVTADKETVPSGEKFVVSYKAESDGDGGEAPEISVEYDENRLVVMECDKEYGGGGGKLTFTDTEAAITFGTLSGGPAEVYVTAILDGDGGEPATGSVTVTVDGEDTVAAADAGESAPAASSTGVAAGTVMSLDGTKVISTVFPDEMMPELFHKTTASYSGTTIEAAQFDMKEDIMLVYVTDEATNTGSFCIIDPQSGELSDFRRISGIENRFIIVLKAPENVEVPLNFTKATLQWNDQTLEAYKIVSEDSDESAEASLAYENNGVSSEQFFLVYAISSDGNQGWYLYDSAEGTYQRYLQVIRAAIDDDGDKMPITEAVAKAASEKYEKPLFIRLIIIGVLGLLALILIIVVIVLAVKLSHAEDAAYDNDEEYDDYPEPVPVRRRRRYEEDEEEDEDEEDDEEDEEDEEDDEDDEDIEDDEEDEEDEEEEEEPEDVKPKAPAKPAPGSKPVIKAKDIAEWQMNNDSDDVFKPRKKKKRKDEPFSEPQAIDWSEMESVVRNAASDSRRPTGNNTSSLPPRYRGEEPDADEEKKGAAEEKAAVTPKMAPVPEKKAPAAEAVRGEAGANRVAPSVSIPTPEAVRPVMKATPIVPANMPKKAGFPGEEPEPAPTPAEEVKAEKKGLFGRKKGLFDIDEDELEDDDKDEGFSFFRRDKKKVPEQVQKRSEEKAPETPAHDGGYGYGQGYQQQGYGNNGQYQNQYPGQAQQGYVNQGYQQQGAQGYQQQGYYNNQYQAQGQNQGRQGYVNQDYRQQGGQGFANRGYDQGYTGQGYQGYNQNYQQGYGQGYQQGYPQGYDQGYPGNGYQAGGMNMAGGLQYQEYPQQTMYNTADFDEDFEFEFLNVD
ncbi:MAG: hypothetical protein K6F34_02065 [Lachnospiraceae bacterium]|nr:hypothetical protein [Lachnospiraceae bacterium]